MNMDAIAAILVRVPGWYGLGSIRFNQRPIISKTAFPIFVSIIAAKSIMRTGFMPESKINIELTMR